MKKITIVLLLLFASAALVCAQTATPASKQDIVKSYQEAEKAYADASIELQRSHIREQKREVVKKAIALTPEQEKSFWPIYDKYESDLKKLNDDRYAMIKDYAANYETMTDAKADELITRAMDFANKRLALRKGYLDEAHKVIPAKTVARLFQLEHQMDMVIDLQIASEVPLIK